MNLSTATSIAAVGLFSSGVAAGQYTQPQPRPPALVRIDTDEIDLSLQGSRSPTL